VADELEYMLVERPLIEQLKAMAGGI